MTISIIDWTRNDACLLIASIDDFEDMNESLQHHARTRD